MFRASMIAILLAVSGSAAELHAAVPEFSNLENTPACRGSDGYAQDFDGARTYLWRPRWIEAIVTDPVMRETLLDRAEKALSRGPYSVTDKSRSVPGANANDYVSIGPYWWPDASDSDGLPYVRRDGEVNPERDGPEFDRSRLRDLATDMRDLSLAWRATREARFAQKASELARAWFIAPESRMNPHFDFAQGIPGRVRGRGEGIIEASDLSTIVEALGVMWNSGALSGAEKNAIRRWYADFALWMATSDIGADEMNKRNNHGVFYDFYLAHFLLFAGAEDLVRNVVSKFPDYRLGVQMDRQGRFIEELKRTRSWHYSHYVVDGAARLATIGECVGLDLWSAELADGRSLTTAREFLARYAVDPSAWPFPDRDHAASRFERMAIESRQVTLYFDAAHLPVVLDDLP